MDTLRPEPWPVDAVPGYLPEPLNAIDALIGEFYAAIAASGPLQEFQTWLKKQDRERVGHLLNAWARAEEWSHRTACLKLVERFSELWGYYREAPDVADLSALSTADLEALAPAVDAEMHLRGLR